MRVVLASSIVIMFLYKLIIFSHIIICVFICPELDMAIAYWQIVLHDKFKFLSLWTKYLLVLS